MSVVISHSPLDREVVNLLAADLAEVGYEVWLDNDLLGAEAVRDRIRGASVFVFALSERSWQSHVCRADLGIAEQLGIPVLFVRVGDVRAADALPHLLTALDYVDGHALVRPRLGPLLDKITGRPGRSPHEPETGTPGGVFVSYRREGTGHFAGRVADRLVERFGADQVFMDVESIEPGLDFRDVIAGAIDRCAVLLAIIGPGWPTARLADADDLVRVEIEAALRRGIRVIPVLVDDAQMPSTADLPPSLAALPRRHGVTVRHASFRQDVGRLLEVLRKVLPDGAE